MDSRTTIREAAKRAGVSIATVSRVVNGRPGVSEDTRHRVAEIVRQLGYAPSAAARELVRGAEATIGLLESPETRRLSPWYAHFYSNLSAALYERGLLLRSIEVDAAGLPQEPAAAFVLLGVRDDDSRIAALRSRGVPFLVVGHEPGCFWVAPDDRRGAFVATAHLLGQGRRRILHLGGYFDRQASMDRLVGYRAALAESRVAADDALLLDGQYTALGAYRAMRRALAGGLAFDAVAAMSDEMAEGALAALEDEGIAVPSRVAVVGFDGLPQRPAGLTTIRQDMKRIAATAVALLGEALAHRPPRGELVPLDLVVGRTSVQADASGRGADAGFNEKAIEGAS